MTYFCKWPKNQSPDLALGRDSTTSLLCTTLLLVYAPLRSAFGRRPQDVERPQRCLIWQNNFPDHRCMLGHNNSFLLLSFDYDDYHLHYNKNMSDRHLKRKISGLGAQKNRPGKPERCITKHSIIWRAQELLVLCSAFLPAVFRTAMPLF